eukprot:2868620-Amphidinium_carterae.2
MLKSQESSTTRSGTPDHAIMGFVIGTYARMEEVTVGFPVFLWLKQSLSNHAELPLAIPIL